MNLARKAIVVAGLLVLGLAIYANWLLFAQGVEDRGRRAANEADSAYGRALLARPIPPHILKRP